jgi:hypothetical protein
MAMNRRLKRWLCIVLLGTLGFAQANLVMAACSMDRANLAQMLAVESHDCCEEGTSCPETGAVMPMSVSACMNHSTSDLQASGSSVSITVPPAVLPVRWVTPARFVSFAPPQAYPVHHRAVPAHILLHSFLI